MRQRLEPTPTPPPATVATNPLAGLDWAAARAVMGVEGATVVERAGEVLLGWARDTFEAQVLATKRESG